MALFKRHKTIDLIKIPEHVAIIVDGNGRWAEKRGLPRSAGHREGAKTVKKTIELAYDQVFATLLSCFSSENWSRPKEEADELMKLYLDYLKVQRMKTATEMSVKIIEQTRLNPGADRPDR